MLKNNNLKICRRLIMRDIKFHRVQYILLSVSVALVCMLYTISLCLGNLTYDGFMYSYKIMYGSESHILFYDLTSSQAAGIKNHRSVKNAVSLSAIGVLSDEMLGNRSVKLAVVSPGWAKETDAVPMQGRMPEKQNEIALDELTMNSLAIPRETGTEVSLRWTPADGGGERMDTFILCGFWENRMGLTETCAWVTEETAQAFCGGTPEKLALGVTLYRPADLEKQGAEILSDLGIQDIPFTTSLAFNDARQEHAGITAMRFYRMNLIVMLCGILMLYHIVRLSAAQDVRFYGRIKSLGMTPRQLRVLWVERASLLSLFGVLPGWLSGFLLCAVLAPHVVVGMEENPALCFFRLSPFPVSGILTFLTTGIACSLPMRTVTGKTPVEAMKFVEKEGAGSRRGRRRRTSLFLMALSGLSRQRGRSLPGTVSLLLALCILCCIWTQGASYDQEKYLEGMALFDYLIADASAEASIQRYNPKSRSITEEIYEALASHPAVTGIGAVRTMEVPMYADEKGRAQILATFEEADENGTARKEYMADNPDWMAGYEKMRKNGEYIGVVAGVGGLTLEKAMARNIFIEGSFSAELFGTGKYVIAAGSSSPVLKTTPPAGSRVVIEGREFEIMASVPYEESMISGADSREAEFNVTYYMPEEVFEELFPDHGIRNVGINIDRNSQKEFEQFLDSQLQGSGASVVSVSDYQWVFRNSVFHNCMIPLFVGSVMLMIGILNFGNVLARGVLVRKKEFAVYESLGMTKRQIRRLLLLEGALYLGSMLLILIPATAVITWLWGRWWLANTNTWCVTWHYSLMPLWISIPILAALVLLVPLYFLNVVTRESVTERMRVI